MFTGFLIMNHDHISLINPTDNGLIFFWHTGRLNLLIFYFYFWIYIINWNWSTVTLLNCYLFFHLPYTQVSALIHVQFLWFSSDRIYQYLFILTGEVSLVWVPDFKSQLFFVHVWVLLHFLLLLVVRLSDCQVLFHHLQLVLSVWKPSRFSLIS